ncbi:MAG: NAD(+) synthase [Clostridiales bacterium]|nr:NAD(+) synthase [Clostridiales bacterium]
MKDGFIKVAAVTPRIKVADCAYNGEQIRACMEQACVAAEAAIVVFPELCITGYSCGDLFWQESLLARAQDELMQIAEKSKTCAGLYFVGLPYAVNGKLYNVAAAVSGGKVLGMVPKTFIPNYNEFYEARHFVSGEGLEAEVTLPEGESVFIGTEQMFCCDAVEGLRVAAEICEDLWTPEPPSIRHAMAGADIIVNLSASDETTGKAAYRRDLVAGQSARLVCGYVYASAGDGESTQDVVYSGHNLIAENGHILAERRFGEGMIASEIDVQQLCADRRRMTTFPLSGTHRKVPFDLERIDTKLTRQIDPAPFVPSDENERDMRCAEILMIQALGLKKRLEHTKSECAVIGISGGLDSTLALLVTVEAFDLVDMDHGKIMAVTMPGFGTTDRTYDNAVALVRCLGAKLVEIDIKKAVKVHFSDIGQDEKVHDVTYENSQARERTQILMDLANKENGIVVGTGDLSELALGWATYNGDHMSMYAVNSSVPKTLVRHLVRYYADTCGEERLSRTLYDVLDTPVSPELLPPEAGQISQKTEELVGPYELHDFFLYHMLRFGSAPGKIYRLAQIAFAGTYDDAYILKWLKTFYRRFFAQQFKRSCLPDGPKVGTVAVSPRGDLRMPSDASAALWMEELDGLAYSYKFSQL